MEASFPSTDDLPACLADMVMNSGGSAWIDMGSDLIDISSLTPMVAHHAPTSSTAPSKPPVKQEREVPHSPPHVSAHPPFDFSTLFAIGTQQQYSGASCSSQDSLLSQVADFAAMEAQLMSGPPSPSSSGSHKRGHSSEEDDLEAEGEGEFSSSSATAPAKKKGRRKRTEPKRAEYGSEEAFLNAWSKWRHTRDSNNLSVKRSREKAKERAMVTEELKSQHEREVKRLECEVQDMRESLSLVLKALARPQSLSQTQQVRVQQLLLTSKMLVQ